MGFQMQRTSEWEIANSTFSPEPLKEINVSSRSHTPIETLDSSESDFPREQEARSGVDTDDDVDLLDALQSDDMYGWLDGAPSSSSNVEKEGKKSEETDAPQAVITPATPKAVELTSDELDNGQPSELVIDEEDLLNRTLTPTEEESPYDNTENGKLIDVECLQPEEGDYTQRSGTYRKNKPSLSPAVRPDAFEGEHQLETNSDGTPLGDYTRRSGTFRKEKPSLVTTPQTSTTDLNDDTSTLANNHSSDTEDELKDDRMELRRDNTLHVEPLTIGAEEPDSYDVEEKSSEQDVDEGEHGEGSGLRRSGTFRKEKPTLQVSPIVRTDRLKSPEYRNDSSQPENSDYPYTSKSPKPPNAENLVIPGVSLDLMVPESSSHTAASPAYVVYPESDSSDGVEESYVLVDGGAVGSGGNLKRSGTFTKKDRSVLEQSPFGDEYF